MDQHDTFGLGRNVPIATGNASDALLALVDGKFIVLRVPYPMGFYAKGMDGRIDDINAGWKGKGLWATYGTRTPFHIEGGKGTTSKVVRFQLRPIRSRDEEVRQVEAAIAVPLLIEMSALAVWALDRRSRETPAG